MNTKVDLTVDETRSERLLIVCRMINQEKNLGFPSDPEEFVERCIYCYGGTKVGALIDFLYNFV